MTHYIDVFNGDADGICSLIQLRLAHPVESTLITGVKRDISLLKQVNAQANDQVTVLDISMQKNHEDLQRILREGAEVFYADHHNAGELIEHENLKAHIDTRSNQCSALIVDRYLGGTYHLWAITAAYGDNLFSVADKLSDDYGLNQAQSSLLKALGIYLNYNGYGAAIDDLFYHPADLFKHCVAYESPFDFIESNRNVFETLEKGYQQDLALAMEQPYIHETDSLAVVVLPAEKWARRVSGVFSNQLSMRFPERAHLILTVSAQGDYLVSIRAPQNYLEGADEIALSFPTGGGRRGAAGINQLAEDELEKLIAITEQRYSQSNRGLTNG
jgi:single-stranded DNA-specific DHH superfamily exonuclease